MSFHFSQDLFDFLGDLTENNNREWFNANKQRYEDAVREPALAFIRAMRPHMEAISPHFEAVDKKVGGSLMRIYRDTRFSKDKTPYKTNLGVQFRHAAGDDVHAPGIYFHIALDGVFLGSGSYRPDSGPLRQIRQRIVERPDAWSAIIQAPAFVETWRQGGESLQRPPRGFDKEHPLVEELKRKSFIAVHDLTVDEVLEPGLPERLAAKLQPTHAYLRFLCEAWGAPF